MGDTGGSEAGSDSARRGFCPPSIGRILVIGLQNCRGDWKRWSSFVYYLKIYFIHSFVYGCSGSVLMPVGFH